MVRLLRWKPTLTDTEIERGRAAGETGTGAEITTETMTETEGEAGVEVEKEGEVGKEIIEEIVTGIGKERETGTEILRETEKLRRKKDLGAGVGHEVQDTRKVKRIKKKEVIVKKERVETLRLKLKKNLKIKNDLFVIFASNFSTIILLFCFMT